MSLDDNLKLFILKLVGLTSKRIRSRNHYCFRHEFHNHQKLRIKLYANLSFCKNTNVIFKLAGVHGCKSTDNKILKYL